MKKVFVAVVALVLMIPSGFGQEGSEMYDLAKIKNNVKNKRVSTYDRNGNNRDHLSAIKDGEKTVLFDVKGAVKYPTINNRRKLLSLRHEIY